MIIFIYKTNNKEINSTKYKTRLYKANMEPKSNKKREEVQDIVINNQCC